MRHTVFLTDTKERLSDAETVSAAQTVFWTPSGAWG